MKEVQISEREQKFRAFCAKISSRGLTAAEKNAARELLDELENAQRQGTLSEGFESSQLPWFRNYVRRVCK